MLSPEQTRESLYAISGISRQAYFQGVKRAKKDIRVEEDILKKVREYRQNNLRTGSRVLYHILNIKTIGITKFERLLSSHNLCGKVKKNSMKTTRGFSEERDKNLINGFILNDINLVIVGDITYFRVDSKFYYIFTLKDAYSKKVLGLGGYLHMTKDKALIVLNQAIEERKEKNLKGTIHHSDAGSQYKSNEYKQRLSSCKMRMSIANNCMENGMAEQLNYMLKTHYLENYNILNENQLNKVLKEVKNNINNKIPVKSLGYKTPNDFEQWIKTINMEERPIQILHDFQVNK